MTQLIVTIEDASLLPDLKKAIKMLRGVGNISVKKAETSLNETTLRCNAGCERRTYHKVQKF